MLYFSARLQLHHRYMASLRRLCSIADIHGDLEQAHAALRLCGLTSEAEGSPHWTAGENNATLVQTGDLVDRGPDSLKVIELFSRLQHQAKEAGGRVELLLGNHEVLNMEGDYRYVHPDELQHAGGVQAWGSMFDPVSGGIGRVVSQHPTAVVAGAGPCRTLFVHAGLRSELLLGPQHSARARLADLNTRMRHTLAHARQPRGAFVGLTGDDGPVWYRGFALQREESVCADLRATLQSVGAWRMIVGHTITPDHTRALPRCAGLLQMMDVGMSKAYYGSLAAWTCDARPGTGEAIADATPLYGDGDVSRFGALQTVYQRPEGGPPTGVDDGGASDAGEDERLVGGTLTPWHLPESLMLALGDERARLPRYTALTLSKVQELCDAMDDCAGFSLEGVATPEVVRSSRARPVPLPTVFRWQRAAAVVDTAAATRHPHVHGISGRGGDAAPAAASPALSAPRSHSELSRSIVLPSGAILLVALACCASRMISRSARRYRPVVTRDPRDLSLAEKYC